MSFLPIGNCQYNAIYKFPELFPSKCMNWPFLSPIIIKTILHTNRFFFHMIDLIHCPQLNLMLKIRILVYYLSNPPPYSSSNNLEPNPHSPIVFYWSFSSMILSFTQVQKCPPPFWWGTNTRNTVFIKYSFSILYNSHLRA